MPRLAANKTRPKVEPKYLPFGEWCRRNGIAPSTGKRMIKLGELKVLRPTAGAFPPIFRTPSLDRSNAGSFNPLRPSGRRFHLETPLAPEIQRCISPQAQQKPRR
jgi:hypothetical protein